MKKTTIIAIALLLATGANAQISKWTTKIKKPIPDERIQTLINSSGSKGFYVAMNMGSQINSKQPFVKMGTSGAFIINDRFGIGAAGFGYTNDVHLDPDLGRYVFAEGGYGGLLLEPIFFSNKRVHLSVPTIMGGGSSIVYEMDKLSYTHFGEWFADADFYHRHNYLVIEPGVNIELNLTKFMRMGFKASYVFTTDIAKNNIGAPSIDGLQAGMNLRLGWF
jgi:hypothetical protein